MAVHHGGKVGKAVIQKDDEWREEKEWDIMFLQMSNAMVYKDYNGTIEYSEEDKCFFGKVIGIRSLISYEGDTVEKLKRDFEKAVDTYLEDCKKEGVEPEQPINGNEDSALNILNEETIAAIEEINEMKKNPSYYKSYKDVDEMMVDLLKEDEADN